MDNSTSTNRNKKSVYGGASTRGGGGTGAMNKSKRSVPAASIDSQSRQRKTLYGGGSRTILSSASRKNVTLGTGSEKMTGPAKPPVQVFDDQGLDVTPLSLLQVDPNAVRKNQSNILADSSAGTPTDLMSQASIYQTGTVTASTFGGGPFTRNQNPQQTTGRSVFSASQSGRSTGSITDDIGEPAQDISSAWAEIRHKREEAKEELNEDDLDKIIDIELSETDTIWLLDLPSICVSADSDEAPAVREQNARYQELVKSRVGNDRYAERGMNTFNDPPKYKSAQTTKIGYNEIGVMATTWDMHDTYKLVDELAAKAKEAQENEDEEDISVSRPASAANVEKEADAPGALPQQQDIPSASRSGIESRATMTSTAGTDSVFASKDAAVSAVPDKDVNLDLEILKSEELQKHLVIMERAVNLNSYQPKQASYRALPIVEDIDKPQNDEDIKPSKISQEGLGPNLDRLWAYSCPLTSTHNVSCMAWNKVNPDLMAVGYGQFEFTEQKSGMVCCWSIKNPEYPERVYTCPAGVTAMDFSLTHPNLLAVGLYDGTVAIYNVRSRKNETVLDSFEASGKHTGPVWQLKWIEKERGSGEERTEVLVSISQDGRVTQWSIRKGFESYDLMKLKRVSGKQGPTGKSKKGEAFISRFAGGLCFDFSPKDTNIYLAGTEEGHIHRCSCSYNEQYLDSYLSHTGPVYGIQWSPFSPDVFLSCGGDWTIKLWHQDRLKPILSFHSSTKSVPEICWSPRASTVFACVNEGAVEIWDLSQSTLDPIIVTNPMQGVKLSCVTFAKNSDCVLVGDSEGNVTVYQLREMNPTDENQAELLNKAIQASLASQLAK